MDVVDNTTSGPVDTAKLTISVFASTPAGACMSMYAATHATSSRGNRIAAQVALPFVESGCTSMWFEDEVQTHARQKRRRRSRRKRKLFRFVGGTWPVPWSGLVSCLGCPQSIYTKHAPTAASSIYLSPHHHSPRHSGWLLTPSRNTPRLVSRAILGEDRDMCT